MDENAPVCPCVRWLECRPRGRGSSSYLGPGLFWEWKLCTVAPPEPGAILHPHSGEQDGQPGCPVRQDARRPWAEASRLHGHRDGTLHASPGDLRLDPNVLERPCEPLFCLLGCSAELAESTVFITSVLQMSRVHVKQDQTCPSSCFREDRGTVFRKGRPSAFARTETGPVAFGCF